MPPLAEVDDHLLMAVGVYASVVLLWAVVQAAKGSPGNPWPGLVVLGGVWLAGWLALGQPPDTMLVAAGVIAGPLFLAAGRS